MNLVMPESSTNKIDIMVSTSSECELNYATIKRVSKCSGMINTPYTWYSKFIHSGM